MWRSEIPMECLHGNSIHKMVSTFSCEPCIRTRQTRADGRFANPKFDWGDDGKENAKENATKAERKKEKEKAAQEDRKHVFMKAWH